MSWKTTILCAMGVVTSLAASEAQRPQEQRDVAISPEIRKEVIDTACKKLNASYIFPETAKKMEAALRQHEQSKDYDGITSAKKLADTLTEHLQAVSHDKHLHVRYSYEPVTEEKDRDEPTPAEREQMRKMGTFSFALAAKVFVLPRKCAARNWAPTRGPSTSERPPLTSTE